MARDVFLRVNEPGRHYHLNALGKWKSDERALREIERDRKAREKARDLLASTPGLLSCR